MSPGYIVTGWEIRVSASPFFLDFITAISKHYGFKTILCPVYLPDLEYLPSSLKERFDIILTTNLKLNQNLEIVLASTHALVKHPLQGWRGAFDHTVIIPALIKSLETEPSQKLSKQLITTGSVGFMTAKPSDYAEFGEKTVEKLSKRWATTQRQGRILAQAQHYVKPSALIVEILSRHRFVTRYVTMDNKRQKFLYDLNLKFDGKRF
ncbi:MAG: hypothetical protein NZM05_12620, partial [Chloroherpetonaceae bacterium]|nr:hypothetical protein [Chloroherpetonaceae bacterium]